MVTHTQLDPLTMSKRVRQHIVRMVYGAQSGHIGGSMSAADIVSVLYTRIMRVDSSRPDWPDRDRFILSKGHCTPVQYAALAEMGYFPVEELNTFRKLGTRLQGHSVLGKPPGVENSAGALGMGLSFGLGIALGRNFRGQDFHVYVLMGDGEQNEGQVWEAAMAVANYKLERIVAIIDRNHIQNDDFTANQMAIDPIDEKYRAFGWTVRSGIDGHDLVAVEEALAWARDVRGGPACVVFETVKGKGVSLFENNPNFHGAAPNAEQYAVAMRELGVEA